MSLRAFAIPLALIVLGFARPVAGAPEIAPPGPLVQVPADSADPLRVFAMTMGPGDHPFFRFGHNAIWIRDARVPSDRVYNFGTFRFDSPRLIFDFLGGRLNYWLSVSGLPHVIAGVPPREPQHHDPGAGSDAAEKFELQAALDVNARPDNRLYKYDYFLDNCSTRVRDAIDRVLKGGLRTTALGPGRMTLREHALRMTAEPMWLYLALDLVLGPRSISRSIAGRRCSCPASWRAASTRRSAGGGSCAGRSRSCRPIGRRSGWSHPRARPSSWPGASRSGWRSSGSPMPACDRGGGRIPFGVVVALWGLVTGFIGSFLVYAWMMTDHVVAHRNQNILLCAPWALAHLVLGIGVAMGRPGATRKAFVLAAAALAAVLAACVMKLGFVAHQQNGPLIAFFLPVWVGVTAGLWWLRAHGRREPG
jgi:hypothetical protein